MKTAVIGMFWRARAYNGGNRHVLAGNGVESAIARQNTPMWETYGGQWRAMAVLSGSPSSSATPVTLMAVNGGSEYNEY